MLTARRQRRGLARAVVVAGALLITGTALLPLWRDDRPTPHAKTTGVAASGASPGASRSGVAGAAVIPAQTDVIVDAALLDTPEARAYLEREQFNDRARHFFAAATHSDATADPREAQWIEAHIGRYERERHLSAGEAMNLRLGLIEASGLPEAERAERMAAIMTAYARDGERREAQWVLQQRNDPAFAQYKSREQAIVADVMAMARIPNGLSRDEYLRLRLEAARIAAMR